MSSAPFRHFFITNDDEILRVPNTKFQRLLEGSFEEKTERFAGKRIRAAEIAVRLEDRKPIKVIRANYYYLHFDGIGILDYDRFMEDGIIEFDAVDSSNYEKRDQGNVIDTQQEFAKRKRDHTVRWKPNMQLERNILDASIDEFKCKRL